VTTEGYKEVPDEVIAGIAQVVVDGRP
jgi:hypothetical protein